LGIELRPHDARLAANGKVETVKEARITDLEANERGLRFVLTPATLPCAFPAGMGPGSVFGSKCLTNIATSLLENRLVVTGLPDGIYTLKIDGQVDVAGLQATDWA